MAKRKGKIDPHEQNQRAQEILTSPVRPDGVGEDPVIRALQSLPEASNVEALDIALALQQLIRGQGSLLSNQGEQSELINRLYARMDAMDQQAIKWEQDKVRFVEEITARADKLRLDDAGQERTKAQAGIDLAQATQRARAQMAVDKQQYDAALLREPREVVVSPGHVEMVTEKGAIVAKLYPEEVRIKHRRWVFMPGIPQEVPASVAAVIRYRRMSQQETAERQLALGKNMESGALENEMKRINVKYQTNGSLSTSEQAVTQ